MRLCAASRYLAADEIIQKSSSRYMGSHRCTRLCTCGLYPLQDAQARRPCPDRHSWRLIRRVHCPRRGVCVPRRVRGCRVELRDLRSAQAVRIHAQVRVALHGEAAGRYAGADTRCVQGAFAREQRGQDQNAVAGESIHDELEGGSAESKLRFRRFCRGRWMPSFLLDRPRR